MRLQEASALRSTPSRRNERDVRGTGIGAGLVVEAYAHHGQVARDGDRVAELVRDHPVSEELLLLDPPRLRATVDIRGARGAGTLVSETCSHDEERVAAGVDGPAKLVAGDGVARNDLLLLDPQLAVEAVDVGGARPVTGGILERSPDHDETVAGSHRAARNSSASSASLAKNFRC